MPTGDPPQHPWDRYPTSWPVYPSYWHYPASSPIVPIEYYLPKFVDPPDIETILKNNKKLWGSFEKLKQNKTSFG